VSPTFAKPDFPAAAARLRRRIEREHAAATGVQMGGGNTPVAQDVSHAIEREAFADGAEIEVQSFCVRGQRVRGRI
jgi:hypothetical protein